MNRRQRLTRTRIPKQRFSPKSQTFTAAMAARTGELFAAAPIVQGDFDGSSVPDALSFGRGSQVHDNFYENFDPYQGSIATIWNPEKGRDAAETDDEYLFYASSTYWLCYEHDTALLRAQIGTQEFTRSHTSVAGTTYSVVVRWDRQNKLDGTNYGCISVYAAETFGATTQPTIAAPGATEYIGSNAGTTLPATGILEAPFVFRIPLCDGTYGLDINAAGTDIINEFYNAGSYEDLAKLIPAWHICFCLPTDATTGQLDTTGQAWGWDYGANVLGTGDGYCATTYGSSNWATEGTPSAGPADFADDTERVFGAQGYQWTCDAADEGINIGLTGLDVGQNYLLVVDAHEDDSSDIRISIVDDTNGGALTNFPDWDFGSGSTRTTMAEGVVTFELPTVDRNGVAADCTAITIKILGTANGQTVFCHQVLLYENLADNPSMEDTYAGVPPIPLGWTDEALEAGDTQASSTGGAIIHGGSDCLQFNAGATSGEGIYSASVSASIGDFIALGCWAYDDIRFGSRTVGRGSVHYAAAIRTIDVALPSAWSHVHGVWRALSSSPQPIIHSLAAGTHYVDDFYAIPLRAVTLTVTAANEANSAEVGGLRVDGYDTCTAPLRPQLARNSRLRGQLEIGVTPRHSIANAQAFGQTREFSLRLYEDANNVIGVRRQTNLVDIFQNYQGVGVTVQSWTATGLWDADTKMVATARWGRGYIALLMNGIERAVIAGDRPLATDFTVDVGWMTAGAITQGDAVATEG